MRNKFYIIEVVFRSKFFVNLLCLFVPSRRCRSYLRKKIIWLNHSYIKKVNKFYGVKIKELKSRNSINVIFFVLKESIWQYDYIYKQMVKDDKFKPVIVVVPFVMYMDNHDERYEREILNESVATYKFFSEKRYNVINAFDVKSNEYIDVATLLEPDIVFFTYPHNLTKSFFYINEWCEKTLTCYVPYGIISANIMASQYNLPLHNLVWRHFVETQIHKNMAKQYAFNKGNNVLVTGYPKCDIFLDKDYTPEDLWSIKDKRVKRIIWAPHHSVEDNKDRLGYSCFFYYADFMIDLALKYERDIQIAFKPHPALRVKLEEKYWGRGKTNMYFKKWRELNNGQVETGDYIDLFLTSDAMVLDSISFISEYLFTGKPSLFTLRDETIENKFNEFGINAFNLLYKASNKTEVENFIKNVINKSDIRRSERIEFLNINLIPLNNQSASKNIVNYIKKEIYE